MKKDRHPNKRKTTALANVCNRLDNNLSALDRMRVSDPDAFADFRSECLLGCGFVAGFLVGWPHVRTGSLWRSLTLLG